MVVKAILDAENHVNFCCPYCGQKWRRDVSSLVEANALQKLRCRCKCKESFQIKLDRRRHFRKQMNLTGAYIHDKRKTRGLIHLRDISKSGARFDLNAHRFMHVGDILLIRFSLDDEDRTFVAKEGMVRKLDDKTVCIEFLATTSDDDNLSRYIAAAETAEADS
jgi:hypothetical protein